MQRLESALKTVADEDGKIRLGPKTTKWRGMVELFKGDFPEDGDLPDYIKSMLGGADEAEVGKILEGQDAAKVAEDGSLLEAFEWAAQNLDTELGELGESTPAMVLRFKRLEKVLKQLADEDGRIWVGPKSSKFFRLFGKVSGEGDFFESLPEKDMEEFMKEEIFKFGTDGADVITLIFTEETVFCSCVQNDPEKNNNRLANFEAAAKLLEEGS
eukprot:TRINITY_DN94476_c0_g1_i1.p1 TRINITY_DN94476_c0_g1~~TRINITY_DN94476_c0_g1_i1.p1  ORF type:complete len:214 (+),score=56.40 TRINITY_DN94476_c0_g1_i1:75-716(+)